MGKLISQNSLLMKNLLKSMLRENFCPRERLCHRLLKRSFAML
uniref:Uncharacterized protein n=1 Tax=Arundo donax TaxID=35708 RepID=A0A0A9G0X0_ARUDO